MPKATASGRLTPLNDCYLRIPNFGVFTFNNLPDVSDSKDVVYGEDPFMGRASPMITYSHSGARTISIQFHFFHYDDQEGRDNLLFLRAIQSLSYPRGPRFGVPYAPPEICKFRCGDLFSRNSELCLYLTNYSFKPPTDVVWDYRNYMPYKFDVDTTWRVAYSSQDLPINTRIIEFGR